MLFGVPLLYTMEVWWIGSFTRPGRLIAVLVLTFVLVFVLNRTSGFRDTKDVDTVDAVIDSIETLAIGIVSVTALLFLLREMTFDTPVGEALGKVVYEATPFCIGIGLARHFLRRGRDEGDDDGDDDQDRSPLRATFVDVGATLIGAVFVAFNIAPTDEIPMLSAAMVPAWLLALVAASLVISYAIVFEAGFANEAQRRSQQGVMQHPVTETVVCYLLALVAAAVMLTFFQRFDGAQPWQATLSNVVVLGLPAAVGGAAGRLAV